MALPKTYSKGRLQTKMNLTNAQFADIIQNNPHVVASSGTTVEYYGDFVVRVVKSPAFKAKYNLETHEEIALRLQKSRNPKLSFGVLKNRVSSELSKIADAGKIGQIILTLKHKSLVPTYNKQDGTEVPAAKRNQSRRLFDKNAGFAYMNAWFDEDEAKVNSRKRATSTTVTSIETPIGVPVSTKTVSHVSVDVVKTIIEGFTKDLGQLQKAYNGKNYMNDKRLDTLEAAITVLRSEIASLQKQSSSTNGDSPVNPVNPEYTTPLTSNDKDILSIVFTNLDEVPDHIATRDQRKMISAIQRSIDLGHAPMTKPGVPSYIKDLYKHLIKIGVTVDNGNLLGNSQ